MLLGVSWTNLNRFPEVDTWGVNVKQLPKRWCVKFLSSDVTVPPQKLYRTALRLTNVFVIVLNNDFNSLVNKEKATSYSCICMQMLVWYFIGLFFSVTQLLITEISITVTHSGADS